MSKAQKEIADYYGEDHPINALYNLYHFEGGNQKPSSQGPTAKNAADRNL